MKEWFEENQEIYSKFKNKIQSVLRDSLYGNDQELIDDKMAALQSIILREFDEFHFMCAALLLPNCRDAFLQ